MARAKGYHLSLSVQPWRNAMTTMKVSDKFYNLPLGEQEKYSPFFKKHHFGRNDIALMSLDSMKLTLLLVDMKLSKEELVGVSKLSKRPMSKHRTLSSRNTKASIKKQRKQILPKSNVDKEVVVEVGVIAIVEEEEEDEDDNDDSPLITRLTKRKASSIEPHGTKPSNHIILKTFPKEVNGMPLGSNTAPTPTLEALYSSSKDLLKFGSAKMEALFNPVRPSVVSHMDVKLLPLHHSNWAFPCRSGPDYGSLVGGLFGLLNPLSKPIFLEIFEHTLAIRQHHSSSPMRVFGMCASVEHPTNVCPILQEIEPQRYQPPPPFRPQ
ncbi:hypothetical protein CR513_17833, partial [Mucuna pruriens]